VCSASYETRAFGVRSAMPISRALRLCPDALCVPVPKECGKKSREIRAALEQWTPVVEGASVDEWYLDMTGTETLYHHEPLAETAQRIRAAVHAATQMTISVGGGPSKYIAKLATEQAKPRVDRPHANGVLIIEADGVAAFLRTLKLSDIPGVGPKAQERLAKHGFVDIADILPLALSDLQRRFGEHGGEWLYRKARGLDTRRVTPREPRKQLSHQRTFAKDISDDRELRSRLNAIARLVASDMRAEGLRARTITVTLRDADFRTRSAAQTFPLPVESDRAITKAAQRLLTQLRGKRRTAARLVGVAVSGFGPGVAAQQLALFEKSASAESERDRRLSRAVDAVRKRFGGTAIHAGDE
jgi:DNA polymerase-4